MTIIKKRLLFKNKYFHILGGGEKFFFSIINALKDEYQIDIVIDKKLLNESLKRFGIDLKGINIIDENKEKMKGMNLLRMNYEAIFYMTDGDIFLSNCKKNFMIVQSPKHIPKNNFINKIKLRNWQIICYSKYIGNIIKEKLNINPHVLYPCVDLDKFNNKCIKHNQIITVGRFFEHLHSKKHDFLINSFKKLNKIYPSCNMIIAGGCQDKDKLIVNRLKRMIDGYPIKIYTNPTFSELKKFYCTSKIYWHAAGYGEDVENYPEKAEHFGITIIEAMASGVYPMVYGVGGPKEIIQYGNSGKIWFTQQELIKQTIELLKNNKYSIDKSIELYKASKKFGIEKFYEKLHKIIN
jgi:glycosyltransferase involved in cell wall biosynthesis